MTITVPIWTKYRSALAKISKKAADEMYEYALEIGGYLGHEEEAIAYAFALATKYGEAAAAAACEMYDAVAKLSGEHLPPAVPAETASYEETARTLRGVGRGSGKPEAFGSATGRLVKQAGADTTLRNALRDGAEFAWVPSGDTCAFCVMLASNGWQRASKKAIKGGHAEHIHSNCDCTYAVRFDGKGGVAGYDPEKYRAMYDAAEGDTWREKLNSMRRADYAEHREEINARKRAAYAERVEKTISTSRKGQSAGNEVGTSGPPEQIGRVDFYNKSAVMEQLQIAEQECAGLPFEVNTTVTSDGKVWRTIGNAGSVDPTQIPSDQHGAYSYHNHLPEKTHYSFSAEDVAYFFESGEEFSMASDDLFEYSMRKTEKTVDMSPDLVYHRFREIEKTTVRRMAWDGLIDPDYDSYHEVMKVLSEEGAFDYERKKKN